MTAIQTVNMGCTIYFQCIITKLGDAIAPYSHNITISQSFLIRFSLIWSNFVLFFTDNLENNVFMKRPV